MIHQYKLGDLCVVLDVCSGSVHAVDEVAYDMIAGFETQERETLVEALAEKYLSLFCKKSDTAKQYVQQWIPIVAARQSLKGKPEERDLLIRWASVCEYE